MKCGINAEVVKGRENQDIWESLLTLRNLNFLGLQGMFEGRAAKRQRTEEPQRMESCQRQYINC
jgi:hypothetical protein